MNAEIGTKAAPGKKMHKWDFPCSACHALQGKSHFFWWAGTCVNCI
jgi:hypothetical protein